MPDPFGLLRPTSVGPGFGSLPSLPSLPRMPSLDWQNPTAQYMPGAQAIGAARAAIGEDKPWWVEALEVPDELFFGQSIKAFMKEIGEGDWGEAAWEAFRKNPIFQAVDMLLPGQFLTGDDVRFTDVRRAWGGVNVEEGVANAIINMIGEMATDPSTFLTLGGTTPGKVLNAGRPAGRAMAATSPLGRQSFAAGMDLAENARYQKWLIDAERALPSAQTAAREAGEQGVASLGHLGAGVEAPFALRYQEATELGLRHFATLKIPWRVNGKWGSMGYVVPVPKALNIGFARRMGKWADFLNSNPLTSEWTRRFSRNAVKTADGDVRAYVADGVNRKAAELEAVYSRPFMAVLSKMAHTPAGVEALKDPDVMRVVMILAESGVTRLDDLSSIPETLQRGIGMLKAEARLKRALTNPLEDQRHIRELWNAMKEGDGQSARRLYSEGYPLPEPILEAHGLEVRRGIDIPGDPSLTPIDQLMKDAVGEGNLGIDARAAVAESTRGLDEATLGDARRMAADLFSGMRKTHGEDLTRQVVDLAETGRELMEQVGRGDVASGVLTQMTEYYLPREMTPAVAQSIHDQFMRGIKNFRGGASAFVSSFMKNRKINELTTFEANHLFWELGTKYTGHIPLKEFNLGREEGLLATAAKIFDSKFIRALKKEGSVSSVQAAEFFQTNPFSLWMRRIEKGAEQASERGLLRHLLHEDSPLIEKTTTLRQEMELQISRQAELASDGKTPLQAVIIYDGPGVFRGVGQGPGGLASAAHASNNQARYHIAREKIRTDVLRDIGEAKRDAHDIVNRIDEALKNNIDELHSSTAGLKGLTVSDLDPEGVAGLKGVQEQIVEAQALQESLRAERKRPDLAPPQVEVTLRDRPGMEPLDLEDLRPRKDPDASPYSQEAYGRRPYEKRIDHLDEGDLAKIKARQENVRERLKMLRQTETDMKRALSEVRSELMSIRKQARDAEKAGRSKAHGERSRAWGTARERIDQARLVKQRRADKIRELAESRWKLTEDEVLIARVQQENGVLAIDDLRSNHPEAYKRMVERTPDAKVAWIGKDNFDAVWGKKGVIENMRRPDHLASNGFVRWLDENTSFWKWWTLMPPVFVQTRARDYISNMVLMVQGGLNPVPLVRGMKQAYRVERALQKAMRGDDQLWADAARKMPDIDDAPLPPGSSAQAQETHRKNAAVRRALRDDLMHAADDTLDSKLIIGGERQDMTLREFIHTLQNKGLIDSSLVRDEIAVTSEQVMQLNGAVKGAGWGATMKGLFPPLAPTEKGRRYVKARLGVPEQNPVIKAGFRVAEFGDNHSKIMGVLGHMEQGKTLDEAIEATRAWTYDPRRGLTTAERHVGRRVLPFYSWLKFAVRSQVGAYLTRPGTVTAWGKLRDSADKHVGMTPEEREFAVPDFVKDNMGIPYKRDDDGNVTYAMFGGYFPIGDIERIVNAFEKMGTPEKTFSPLHWLGENTNPYIKTMIEQALNYSFYKQRDLEVYPGQPTEFMGLTWSKKSAHSLRLIRGAYELNKLLEPWLSPEKMEALVAASQAGGPPAPTVGGRLWESALNPLPRPRVIDTNRELTYRYAQAERMEGKYKGQLRKAAEHPERGAQAESIAVTQGLLADKAAEKEAIEELQRKKAAASRGLLR